MTLAIWALIALNLHGVFFALSRRGLEEGPAYLRALGLTPVKAVRVWHLIVLCDIAMTAHLCWMLLERA